jgi:hypothetical protein
MTNLAQLQKYFSEVLGVREILVNPAQLERKSNTEDQAQDLRLIFLDEKKRRTQEGKDLLEKMIGAMKLAANDYKVLELEISEISENLNLLESAKTVVSFSKTFSEFIQNNFPRVNLKSTIGPEELLLRPELKREVWEILKNLM